MSRSRCFFVMPFRPELNFFYLYLAKYLNEAHNLEVSRGDSDILDKPLMEKIAAQIAAADVIIADITGGNPNVFYEVKYKTPEGIVFDVTANGWRGAVKNVIPADKS